MKKVFLVLSVFSCLTAFCQMKVAPTDSIFVMGKIKKELRFGIGDIENLPSKDIGDVVITNHLGEAKGTAKAMKGILVKDLLNSIEYSDANQKLNSRYYFVFIASDDYKVVYSWNEIFNSPTGDHVFLVTEKEGKKISAMEDRMLIISPTDTRTGRRYIKGLKTIIVEMVN